MAAHFRHAHPLVNILGSISFLCQEYDYGSKVLFLTIVNVKIALKTRLYLDCTTLNPFVSEHLPRSGLRLCQ
jgi:hypothetical protein